MRHPRRLRRPVPFIQAIKEAQEKSSTGPARRTFADGPYSVHPSPSLISIQVRRSAFYEERRYQIKFTLVQTGYGWRTIQEAEPLGHPPPPVLILPL